MRKLEQDYDYREAAKRLLRVGFHARCNPVNRQAKELSAGEKGLLQCLFVQKEATAAGKLGKLMGIRSGGVANLLNSLEKKGLVQRTMSPDDRRSVLVTISDAGCRLVEEKQREVLSATERLLARMGKENTEEFLRLLELFARTGDELLQEETDREGGEALC